MLRKNDLQRSQGQSQEMLRARCVMSGAVIRIDQHVMHIIKVFPMVIRITVSVDVLIKRDTLDGSCVGWTIRSYCT
jgi:hypothetical protein